MAVVSLKIGGRFYKFSCNDGQDAHMRELAEQLDKRAESLTKSIGFMPEGQLLAMICLLLAEEKHHLERATNAQVLEQTTDQIAQSIQNLALKVGVLAESLEQ
ncbi:MAG: cell division protein ZapA [Alphaproteobacteria bacterium]|nr:cell division protein ZapA [Alphaproteobacteria bacterium]